MKVRVITAVIGIIAVLLLVWLGGVFFSGAVLAVALLAVHEYNKMLKNINVHVVVPLIAAAQLVLIGAASFGSLKVFLGMIPLCLVLLLCPILKLNQDKMTSLIYTVFGSFYFGIGFGALILLRRNADLITQSSLWMEPGIFLVMFALVDTWASDSLLISSAAALAGIKWHRISARIKQWKDFWAELPDVSSWGLLLHGPLGTMFSTGLSCH